MEKFIASREQKELCRLLRQVRRGQGLSQAELAESLGEPQSFVSRYETGQQRLDVLELRKVCQALGLLLSEFAVRLERSLGDS